MKTGQLVSGPFYLDNLFFRALPPLTSRSWSDLLAFGETWKYATTTPPANWFAAGFDDGNVNLVLRGAINILWDGDFDFARAADAQARFRIRLCRRAVNIKLNHAAGCCADERNRHLAAIHRIGAGWAEREFRAFDLPCPAYEAFIAY